MAQVLSQVQICTDLLGRRMVAGAEPLGYIPAHSDTGNSGLGAFVSRVDGILGVKTASWFGHHIRTTEKSYGQKFIRNSRAMCGMA